MANLNSYLEREKRLADLAGFDKGRVIAGTVDVKPGGKGKAIITAQYFAIVDEQAALDILKETPDA